MATSFQLPVVQELGFANFKLKDSFNNYVNLYCIYLNVNNRLFHPSKILQY